MIGNQTKGKSFRGLLNYLENKQGASLIGGNMFGRNARELAREFRLSRQLNPEAQKVVHHVSLSLPPGEQLENETWCELADKYMEEMGYTANQYVIYRHNDSDHDHIHIAASRINLDDGKITKDSWEYVRSEKIIRQLEHEYSLQPARSSRDKLNRAPSIGQQRRIEREQQEYERGERAAAPFVPTKAKLQELIDRATTDRPTMPQLIERLQQSGVEIRHGLTRNGKSKGISYAMDGQQFSGTTLGPAYTFPGLQKHKGIDYQPQRDDQRIEQLLLNPATSKPTLIQIEQQQPGNNQTDTEKVELLSADKNEKLQLEHTQINEKLQLERTQIVAPILAGVLETARTNRFVGEKHTIYKEGKQLVLVNNSSGIELMRARYQETESQWEPVGNCHLTNELVQHFQKFIPQVEKGLEMQKLEKQKSLENRYRGRGR